MTTRAEAFGSSHPRAGAERHEPPRSLHFGTAWCGVGGERGGVVVPRWFDVLPDLGVRSAHLFWSVPETDHADAALDALRSVSGRWLVELRALDIHGELSIKRGEPAPWLAALADLSPDALIVLGPPAHRGAASDTLAYLLRRTDRALLVLPDLLRPPDLPLFARPVVDSSRAEAAAQGPALWNTAATEWLDLAPLDPTEAVRSALRLADDVDASVLVLPRRSTLLVPLAVGRSNFPLLVPRGPRGAAED